MNLRQVKRLTNVGNSKRRATSVRHAKVCKIYSAL
nr:MAG TPA: hypothetical protein [Caudoviricetes sp.]